MNLTKASPFPFLLHQTPVYPASNTPEWNQGDALTYQDLLSRDHSQPLTYVHVTGFRMRYSGFETINSGHLPFHSVRAPESTSNALLRTTHNHIRVFVCCTQGLA